MFCTILLIWGAFAFTNAMQEKQAKEIEDVHQHEIQMNTHQVKILDKVKIYKSFDYTKKDDSISTTFVLLGCEDGEVWGWEKEVNESEFYKTEIGTYQTWNGGEGPIYLPED
jgi:hypothetical protein